MTRISKKAQRRAQSPRRRRQPSEKTGPRKDNLPLGYKAHANACEGELGTTAFISKVK